MRTSAIACWLGAAVLALAAGCGGDDKTIEQPATFSRLGESCARTGDCATGLVCRNNRCELIADGSAGTGGSTGTDAGSPPQAQGGGGSTPITPPSDAGSQPVQDVSVQPVPVVLSGLGESCTRTADCKAELLCIQQTCVQGAAPTTPDAGDAGTPPVVVGPRLGQRGESCTNTSDCAAGLGCRPPKGISSASVIGVCDLLDFGIAIPTTPKTCGECNTALDCCELPLGTTLTDGTAVHACQDIQDRVTAAGLNCTTPTDGDNLCFLLNTYCNCTATSNPWKCTENACVYDKACTGGAVRNTITGCPTKTRSGTPVLDCSAKTGETGGKCTGPGVEDDCASAGDCYDQNNSPAGKSIHDRPGETCHKDECTCYQNYCYRKCAKDLDCPSTTTCDLTGTTTKNLCTGASRECTVAAQCITKLGDVKAVCAADGTCQLPCEYDLDCNPLGSNHFANYVCNKTKKVCQTLGTCTHDTDCLVDGGVKLFCVAPPAGTGTAGIPASAITNGTK